MKLFDRYLVRIQSSHETEFRHGSLVLERPSLTERIEAKDMKNCSFNPDMHLTCHGLVAEAPHSVTKRPARILNMGLPQPSRHISGEMIIKSDGGLSKENYNPSTYTDVFLKQDEIYSINAAPGDILHFYHTAVLKAEPVEDDLFAVNVADAYAFTRDGVLYACNGFLLCEKVERPKIDNGLHLESVERDHSDRGIVAVSWEGSEVNTGETVWHRKNCDYAVELGGRSLFVVREYDCLCAE